MPYVAYGSPRDKQYRRAIEADDNPSSAQYQSLLISAPQPNGKQYFPDDVRDKLLGKKLASYLRSEDYVYDGPPSFVLTSPTPYGNNYDQPLAPKGYKVALHNKTFIWTQVTWNLKGQDAIYGSAGQAPTYDLPNPPKGRPYPSSNRTYNYDQPLTNLIGQDRLQGAPGQVPDYDWIVPKGKPYPIANRSYTYNDPLRDLIGQDTILGAPGQVPDYEWVVPKGRSYPLENRTYNYNDPLRDLIGQDNFFGTNGQVIGYDWSNPLRRPIRQYPDLSDNGLNNLLFILISTSPFGPFDWELPNRILRSKETGYIHPFDLNLLIGQDQLFGSLGQVYTYDWQLPPKGRAPINKGSSLGISEFLIGFDSIYAGAGQVPNYDWTVPKGYKSAFENKTYIESGIPFLIGKDTIYGASGEVPTYDWIVPRGRKPAWENKTFLELGMPFLIGQDKLYGSAGEVPNYEWIVPKGRVPLNKGSYLGLSEFLIGQDSFYGASGQVPTQSFPNPTPAKGRIRQDYTYDPAFLLFLPAPVGSSILWTPDRRLHTREDFIRGTSPSYFPVLGIPFNKYDYPNPLIAKRPLFYYVQGNLLVEVSDRREARIIRFIPNLDNLTNTFGVSTNMTRRDSLGTEFDPTKSDNIGTPFNPNDPGYSQ